MSKQHTPGPWEWDEYGNVTADGALIARVDWRNGDRNEPLIAAAPDMLQELEILVEACEQEGIDCQCALTVIRWAKGEQE